MIAKLAEAKSNVVNCGQYLPILSEAVLSERANLPVVWAALVE